jgi:hypothetical protein
VLPTLIKLAVPGQYIKPLLKIFANPGKPGPTPPAFWLSNVVLTPLIKISSLDVGTIPPYQIEGSVKDAVPKKECEIVNLSGICYNYKYLN